MKTNITYILVAAAWLFSGCTKKLDYTYDNRINQQPITPSTIRLVNLCGATELTINGQALTSFTAPDRDGYYGPDQTKGTRWFPENGRMGTTYTVPRAFVDKNGWADSILFSSLSAKVNMPPTRPFWAKDDDNNPKDYYFVRYRPNAAGYEDSLFAIPRGISPAADPAACKVRFLNLSSIAGPNTVPGVYRSGAMSVAFADGTLITGLSNVAPGTYSDYISLPYGTYQLKVLAADGKEVPGNGSLNTLNPSTGTLMDQFGDIGLGNYKDTWLSYAPIKTFQPGGVYTIVVAMNWDAKVPTGNPNGETMAVEVNTFRIIADITEPLNNTYARMQGVNVLPGKKISWTMDGQPMGNTLPFSGQTDYSAYVTGMHILKAMDENKQVLAETQVALQPADNLTAWLYPRKDGSPAISLVANNLSGRFYNGNATDNGAYSIWKDGFPFWIRCMNFCPDLDEMTFTADNGLPFRGASYQATDAASQHLLLGKPVADNPYVILNLNFSNSMLAYASRPGVTPGDWIRSIPVLNSRAFIARPELYKTPSLPRSEPGVYTVALVGSTAANAPEKARMIIVKHNK
ncbi:DUF4397 domain-containing protein [Chitinophaga eiseniae]|uniref:DUF4397 domain-containing protein n=1 Tax=Chitinophaga eiseniae TaxID=634771 RepID=A0A847SPS7_9BACT|nr:DUF4397 domain-containing protein [Chitinophaga eiseniae]NLR81415.1 DUF4397 domain-containing protein [Chitinophaga eiseniae]